MTLHGQSEHGPTQRHDADCLPAAVAGLLGVPLELVPEVDHEADDWLTCFNLALSDAGWPFVLLTDRPWRLHWGRWIAVVPSLSQPELWHAVVMDGSRLLHDPGRPEKGVYTSVSDHQIKCAIYVVATGPGWGPRADPTWVPRELNC